MSWADDLSIEPLPEVRQYLVDRTNLFAKGNTTFGAMQVDMDVECFGFPLTQVNSTKTQLAKFRTDMNSTNPYERDVFSSEDVLVRARPQMAT